MAGAITEAVRAARRKWVERLAGQLDPELPGFLVRSEWRVDDGCGYDRGFDPRPDIVKADDAALRRRKADQ